MHTFRAILATEALIILSTSVFGVVMPSALVQALTGQPPDAPLHLLPWLCALTAALALLQLELLEDPRKLGFRVLVQCRLLGDFLLLLSVVLHTHHAQRYLSLVSLTLVFAAVRFYALIVMDEAEVEPLPLYP